VPKEKIFAQARDELFSHINRCGVLSATDDDRTTWMTETIDYIGERYPDLVDPDLRELHQVGIRFCQPAINNVPAAVVAEPVAEPAAEPVSEVAAETTATATATDASEVVDAPEVAEVPEAAAQPASSTS
jgi:hypothetical protein